MKAREYDASKLEPESTTEGYGRLGFLKRAGAFGSNGSPIASPTMRHSFGVGCCRCGKETHPADCRRLLCLSGGFSRGQEHV